MPQSYHAQSHCPTQSPSRRGRHRQTGSHEALWTNTLETDHGSHREKRRHPCVTTGLSHDASHVVLAALT